MKTKTILRSKDGDDQPEGGANEYEYVLEVFGVELYIRKNLIGFE